MGVKAIIRMPSRLLKETTQITRSGPLIGVIIQVHNLEGIQVFHHKVKMEKDIHVVCPKTRMDMT